MKKSTYISFYEMKEIVIPIEVQNIVSCIFLLRSLQNKTMGVINISGTNDFRLQHKHLTTYFLCRIKKWIDQYVKKYSS